MERSLSSAIRLRVASGGDAVTDALGAEQFDGFAHGLRAADFAGMRQTTQAVRGNKFVDGAKIGRGDGEFVAAKAVGDHAFVSRVRRRARDFHSRVGAELAHGVEDPLHAQASWLEGGGGFANRAEIGLDVLPAQEHHADRKRDFGVDDILSEQVLGQTAGDQRIVRGRAQVGSHPLVGFDEGGEVGRGVTRGHCRFVDGVAVARGERDHCGGRDASFEVQVQLGFGQGAELRRERSGDGAGFDGSEDVGTCYCLGRAGRPALIHAVSQ